MSVAARGLLFVMVFAAGTALAAGPDAEQRRGLQMLHDYGSGYADAIVQGQLDANVKTPNGMTVQRVKLRSSTIGVAGTQDDGSLRVASLTLERGGYKTLDVMIGATTAQQLRQYFGPPESEDARRMVYPGPTEICRDSIVFHLDRGKLARIEWDFCYD